ncbi:hypothetical protein P0Y35_04370 [Kiritimatiellaeota bacterium B1221]|nr:hypothetical protein [Kiritimatiellaeota bacterium B1221]
MNVSEWCFSASVLLCAMVLPAQEQPEGLPRRDQIVFAEQKLPALAWVKNLKPAPFPVYGIYTWMGEFNQLKQEIKEVGYKTLRVGGKYSDENMKALFDTGLNFTLLAPDGGRRDAFETDDAYIEASVQALSGFLDRFGEEGSFYRAFPAYRGRYIPYLQLRNEPNFHYMYKAGTEAEREALYARLAPQLIEVIRAKSPRTKIPPHQNHQFFRRRCRGGGYAFCEKCTGER